MKRELKQVTKSQLRSELMYEGIVRADALNIPKSNLFQDTNVYARTFLVDSGADVRNLDFGRTP